jgi:hypothetical protein
MAAFQKDALWGFIDTSGKVVLDAQFDEVLNTANKNMNVILVKQKGKYGFVDKTANLVLKPQFDEVKPLGKHLLQVKQDKKWGILDKNAKVIAFPQFDAEIFFSTYANLAVIVKNKNYGLVDTSGNVVADANFGYIGYFMSMAWL